MKKSDKSKITEEEKSLFRDEMQNVTPMNDTDRLSRQQRPHPARSIKIQTRHPTHSNDVELLNPKAEDINIASEQLISYADNGVRPQQLRRLKRGQIAMEQRLDLHGKTVAQARSLLLRHIEQLQRQHVNTLLIIHGKSLQTNQQKPIIKNHVAYWLRQHPAVLAYTSAQPQDGGAGAVYVLLRRS